MVILWIWQKACQLLFARAVFVFGPSFDLIYFRRIQLGVFCWVPIWLRYWTSIQRLPIFVVCFF